MGEEFKFRKRDYVPMLGLALVSIRIGREENNPNYQPAPRSETAKYLGWQMIGISASYFIGQGLASLLS